MADIEISALTGYNAAKRQFLTTVGGSAGLVNMSDIGSAAVAYTDNVATSNADLSIGSTTFGTDQTAALQALLDIAAIVPGLLVIWNGCYSVTDLRIRSNTRISVLPSCGAIQRNGTNKPLLRNYNQTLSGAVGDRNIELYGGIWNGNRPGQTIISIPAATGQWSGVNTVFDFRGVSGLTMRDFKIVNPKTYATTFINVFHVKIDSPDYDANVDGSYNHDFLHFNGPCQYIDIRNVTATGWDDIIAFNADDLTSVQALMPGWVGGPITDFSVDGLTLADGDFGIRLLSGTNRIDRGSLRNIKGKTGCQWLIIDNLSEDPSQLINAGPGNFGSILIDGVDVVMTRAGYKNCHMFVQAHIESLRIKNVHRTDFQIENYFTLLVTALSHIKQLIQEDWTSLPTAGSFVEFQTVVYGTVDQHIIDSHVYNWDGATAVRPISLEGTTGQLVVKGCLAKGFSAIYVNYGTVNHIHYAADNFID